MSDAANWCEKGRRAIGAPPSIRDLVVAARDARARTRTLRDQGSVAFNVFAVSVGMSTPGSAPLNPLPLNGLSEESV